MNEVLLKRLVGACALVGLTLLLANLLPEPSALPPPEPAAKRVTYDLRPALPERSVTVAEAPIQSIETGTVAAPAPVEPGKAPEPKVEVPPPSRPKPAPPKPEAKPATAADSWFVQIGAFAKESNAQQSVARLRKAGLQARQDTLEWKSGTRYRVRCGPFASKAEAEAERERATRLGFGDARLAHEPAG